ncbi:MAG TPA: glycosyltransferase [Candidatus Magasanikbacteria bacterium]|nr:glycosyltransferase [Candidatus Magasanikbacteria bacterium]
MKKIKILHIIPTLSRGGAERCVVDLVNHSSADFSAEILLLKNIMPRSEELHTEPHVCEKHSLFDFGYTKRLADMIREINPDIVHTHLWGADVYGRRAAQIVGVPIVTTEHNLDYGESWLRHFLKRRTARLARLHVAASRAIARYAAEVYHVKNAEVIRYGIELNKFTGLLVAEFSGVMQVLMLGRLVPQKGHVVGLTALAQSGIDFHLRVVGDGELRNDLEKKARRLGISDRVAFLPATGDVVSELVQADILLMPSMWEGLGIVAEEAMAAGRVVIASEVDGLAELMQSGVTGYYFPRGDVARAARALQFVASHPSEARQVAFRAREFAENNFAVGEMVASYEAVYRRVLGI